MDGGARVATEGRGSSPTVGGISL